MGRKTKKQIESCLCPLCGGRGVIFSEIEDVLERKIQLFTDGKIPRGQVTNSIYEFIFLKYGLTPTIEQVSQFYEIRSVDVYRDIFLPKLQRIAKSYIDGKKSSKKARQKRLLSVAETDDGTITTEAIDELLKKQNYKCAICKTSITLRGNRHLDHIIPLSKDGIHSINNVQWLCVRCNVKKGNKLKFNVKEE